MYTSANLGDTSRADVDSIDTPPRVSLSSSPAQTKPAANTAKTKLSENLEDIFDSRTSSSVLLGTHIANRTSRQTEAEAANVRRIGSDSTSSSRSSEVVAASASASCTSSAATASAPAAAATRVRVPSKEALYGRRSSSSGTGGRRQTTSPKQQTNTLQEGHGASWRPEDVDRSAMAKAVAANTSSSLLAEQYGGQKKERSLHNTTTATAAASASSATRQQNQRISVVEHIVDLDDDASSTTNTASTDALLRRMQNKEKEFDDKIHVIHDTFQNAGEQLVVRDSIIAQLQRELAEMRAEASRIPKEYQEREEKFLLRVEDMMRELREEQKHTKHLRRVADEDVKRLRAALDTAEQQLAQQQRVSEDLLRQLRTSDKALQAETGKHAAALQENRRAYEDKLSEFQRAYSALEKQLVQSHVATQDVEKERAECQARLLEYEVTHRRQRSSDSLRCKELIAENEALREEVEAVQLSMARLLRLLAEVPAIADYLRWNELSSEFVFLGYPTRYFANGTNVSVPLAERGGRKGVVSPSSRVRSPQRQRADSHRTSPSRRRAGQDASALDHSSFDASSGGGGAYLGPSSLPPSPYYQDVNLSGGSFQGTGVDDGVYAGVASSLSKNVWLNGRWAQQMMDIIAAENNFTRLKRIKLLELEEAAQLSEQLPSARDVLEGRQPERDYWIPYAVFTEAQKFKNKYYPKLPAMSHFYPFLIQLNKIWRAKLQDRLRVRQGEAQRSSPQRRQQQQQQQQQQQVPYDSRQRKGQSRLRRTHEKGLDGEANSLLTSRSNTTSQMDAQRSEALLSQLVQCEARIDDIHAEHHRLRREVRLHVSSQKSLQLFRLYDELVRGAHGSLVEAVQLADDLHSSAAAAQVGAADADARKRTALDVLHAEQRAVQLSVDVAEAVEARDRLLCVVERTCERVCAVGDSLSTQMMSYYSDLHQLIHILHDHLRQVRSGDSGSADDDKMSGFARGAQERRRSNDSDEEGEALRRSLRRMLRDQYGREASRTGATAGAAAAGAAPASSVKVESLLKVAASVLDFGDEVRKEVTTASAALRQIAEQAMHDADDVQAR